MKAATGFAAVVGMCTAGEKAIKSCLQKEGSGPDDVALHGAYPTPTGEVETFSPQWG